MGSLFWALSVNTSDCLDIMNSVAVLFLLFGLLHCKRYKRCELAEELRSKHNIVNREFLANLVCIGHYESGLQTDAVGTQGEDGSHDNGLFQISDKYWCERPGFPSANVCNVSCSALLDEDLSDDVSCVRRIYLETAQLSGDGFSAWVGYTQHCAQTDIRSHFLKDCPDF